jgi:hypothetical protein
MDNGNSSYVRLFAQLIPTFQTWNSSQSGLPMLQSTIAEALSQLSYSMLMKIAINSIFHHYWNHTAAILDPGVYESFNASLRAQQYASGPVFKWQGIFYPVLAFMFLGNLLSLVYFSLRIGLVSDLTEPQTSFVTAMNSPFSPELTGSCGSGPDGRQLIVNWHVRQDENKHYYFDAGGGEQLSDGDNLLRKRT